MPVDNLLNSDKEKFWSGCLATRIACGQLLEYVSKMS